MAEPGLTVSNGVTQQWQGQERETAGDLVYMNARFYDRELGQFTTADSIIPNPYQPQSLNRYDFAYNNPTSNTDPSGNMPIQVERKKEQAAGPGIQLLSTCRPPLCELWDPPATPEAALDLYLEDLRFTATSGGVGSVSDSAVTGETGDPLEWAQFPGEGPLSAPPLVDVPPGVLTSPRTASLMDGSLQDPARDIEEPEWRMPSDDSTDPGATLEQILAKYGEPFEPATTSPSTLDVSELQKEVRTQVTQAVAGAGRFVFATYGLVEAAAGNVIGYAGAAVGELAVTAFVRVPNVIAWGLGYKGIPISGTELDWVRVKSGMFGVPIVEMRWGLFGVVQRAINILYRHDWDTMTGHDH